MTINEAIEMVDRLKPNQYEHEQKVGWLSKLDGMIYEEIISTHEGNELESFEGYKNASPDTELLVKYPYDEDVYNYFLQAQIDKENGEMSKFNQSITLYNNSYKIFSDAYTRKHRFITPVEYDEYGNPITSDGMFKF